MRNLLKWNWGILLLFFGLSVSAQTVQQATELLNYRLKIIRLCIIIGKLMAVNKAVRLRGFA